MSSDFSSLCDRFLRYEALTSTVEPTGAESIDEVRSKLAEIVRENPDGLRGSEVKVMLRRVLSSSFDESAYGFRSFGSFLGRMDGVVRVVPAPRPGAIFACTRFRHRRRPPMAASAMPPTTGPAPPPSGTDRAGRSTRRCGPGATVTRALCARSPTACSRWPAPCCAPERSSIPRARHRRRGKASRLLRRGRSIAPGSRDDVSRRAIAPAKKRACGTVGSPKGRSEAEDPRRGLTR